MAMNFRGRLSNVSKVRVQSSMVEQILRDPLPLTLYIPIYVSFYLPIYVSIYLVIYVSICLAIYVYTHVLFFGFVRVYIFGEPITMLLFKVPVFITNPYIESVKKPTKRRVWGLLGILP